MAFRIPFNEHLIIEADTPADVRALLAEFGASLGPRQLPAPASPIPPVEPDPVGRRAASPSVKRTVTRTPRAASAVEPDGEVGELGASILTALQAGPLGTGDLARKTHATAYAVLKALKQFAAQHLVHSTGATISLRWHLGAQGSRPKEAESRRA